MARNPRHNILFEPVEVGSKVLRNRFYGVPYGYGAGPGYPMSHVEHRTIQAEGGWAVVYTGVTATSADWEGQTMERLMSEADMPPLEAMCAGVHKHGALAGIEFGHVGADSPNRHLRHATIGPSQLASWRRPSVIAKEMEMEDIERVQNDIGHAAGLAKQAGFDLICLYGAFSYLNAQFLSPFHNKRTDKYGGSLVNRARFWIESLQQIRDAVGDTCVVSSRIAAAGLSSMGISLEETLEFISMADDYNDLWDITLGAEWEKDSGSSRFFKEGWQLEWSGKIRSATKKPIVGVARLTDPDRMADIIRSGVWDLIGAARPRISDPFLPNKISEGKYEDIRECTGSNICIASMYQNQLTCLQNPTTGEEYRRGWHPESIAKAKNAENDVLVIGAGPAGMECAATLARRGMRRVHLVDAMDELGGALSWVSNLPRMGEWGRVINYRKIQLDKARQVEVILNTSLGFDDVREYGAEIVIIATGSLWSRDGLNYRTHEPIAGADSSKAYILTPDQIMRDVKQPTGQYVLVYDMDGGFMAPALAEKLKSDGFSAQIVTSLAKISPQADDTMEGSTLRRHLRDAGIIWQTSTTINEIIEGGVYATNDSGQDFEIECDSIVLVTNRLSCDGLYKELKANMELLQEEEITAVYRVGDCVTPRSFADAIFEGHRLAREIDSPNPAFPMPVRPDGNQFLPKGKS